jgi:hypothetical protein
MSNENSPERVEESTWFELFASEGERRSQELFHYTTAGGLIGILQGKSLRAPHASFSNDAAETRYGVEFLRDRGKRILPGLHGDAKTLFEALLEVMAGWLQETAPYVFCLTKNEDQLSQWRAYGSVGSGFAIGFVPGGLESLRFAQGNGTPYLAKVIYDEEKKQQIADTGLLGISRDFQNQGDVDAVKRANRIVHYISSCFKHHSFSEEQEWRLVCGAHSDAANYLSFYERGSMPVPCHTITTISQGDLLPINKIIVGPHRHSYEAERGVDLLLKSAGYTNVSILRSNTPFRSL